MDGMDLPFLIPPLPYGHVEDNVYRGSYPKLRNLRFLKRLKLKTIVSLTPDPIEYEQFKTFCEEQNIEYIHIHVEKPKDSLPLTYAKVAQIIQIILDTNKLPIFVHCLDGSLITGVIFMCLRKLQLWDSSIIHIEYIRYTRDDEISSEAIEFVEKYNGEIVIPEKIPHWLWNGQIPFKKHPTMKIRLPDLIESESKASSDNANSQNQNNVDNSIKEKTNNTTNPKSQNNNINENASDTNEHNVQEMENQNLSHSKHNINEAMTEEFTEAIRKKLNEKIIALRKSGKYSNNNEESSSRNHNFSKSPSSRNTDYEKIRKFSNGQKYYGNNRNDDFKEGYNTNNTNSEYESNDDLYDSYYSGTNISDDEFSDNDDNSDYNDYNDNDDDKEDDDGDSYSTFGNEDRSNKSYDISEINYQKMSLTLKALNLEGLNTH